MNARKDESGAAAPWWQGAVLYQVYPRSFRDTTGNGVGDLDGIIEGLAHIASLGVDGIWLSPFFRSPMRDFGYDVSDYCDVDPLFGTLDGFDRLIARAHALGLKVIIDQVYSHTSDVHDWFSESRADRTNAKADWYVWADPKPDGSPPNNWQSVFGGPSWEWDARRQQYYLHNFLTCQPDLNLHNPHVQAALVDVADFWLKRGVDGFRIDAINFGMHDLALRDNPPSGLALEEVTRPFDMQHHVHDMSRPELPLFLEKIAAKLREYGARFSVAEVVGPDPSGDMKLYTQGAARLSSAYSFDFLYAERLGPEVVRSALGAWGQGNDPDEGWPSWAFSNHDAPRAVSRWAPPEQRDRASRCLLLLLLSLRGNVFLYQGEELGLPQAHVPFEALQDPEAIANWPRTLGRDGARTPMPWRAGVANAGFSSGEPWLPADPAHDRLAVDQQDPEPASVLNLTRALVRCRAGLPAMRRGALQFEAAPPPLIAFRRTHDGEEILCVYNVGKAPAGFEPAGGYELIATGQGVVTGGAPPSQLDPWTGYWARRVRG